MPRVPFLGRLHVYEYLALSASILLVFLETLVRTITLLLPSPIIRFCYRLSRNAFNSLSSPYSRRARNKKKSVSSPIAHASDFVELCELSGYYAEEHIVQTKDGYLLGLHRLGWRKGEEEQRINAGPGSIQKKVVYLHHGLLMNSEVWVCITEKERCLPFLLVDRGYDVWLGNNRGNKYSKKCLHSTPTDAAFWNFSMDQFAFHDIPDSIDYVLSTTHQATLSYIGFSQGSAQAFATLSIHPTLNAKVSVFIALAPAMAPPGLASGIVSSLVKSNPELLFLAFGRRALLSSATMWQALLYPGIFVWFIDKSLRFLFNWRTANITPHQKLAAYPHLYSFTSTKSVVHWFQIIRNGTFQMFDDELSTSSPLALSNGAKYYKVAKFPTRNIKTPIVLIYGGSDSLVDIKLMLKELPRHTIAKEVRKYEHLDFLWASDVDLLVFPHVMEALEKYTLAFDSTKALGWRNGVGAVTDKSMASPNGSLPPRGDERVRRRHAAGDAVAPSQIFEFGVGSPDRPSTAEEQLDESDWGEDEKSGTPERYALTPSRASPFLGGRSQKTLPSSTTCGGSQRTVTPRRIMSPRIRGKQQRQRFQQDLSLDEPPDSPTVVPDSEFTSHSTRPEGWWSSTTNSTAESSPHASRLLLREDHTATPSSAPPAAESLAHEPAHRIEPAPAIPARHVKRPSDSAALSDSDSHSSVVLGPRGLGVAGGAKAGVVTGEVVMEDAVGSPTTVVNGGGKKRARKD